MEKYVTLNSMITEKVRNVKNVQDKYVDTIDYEFANIMIFYKYNESALSIHSSASSSVIGIIVLRILAFSHLVVKKLQARLTVRVEKKVALRSFIKCFGHISELVYKIHR